MRSILIGINNAWKITHDNMPVRQIKTVKDITIYRGINLGFFLFAERRKKAIINQLSLVPK